MQQLPMAGKWREGTLLLLLGLLWGMPFALTKISLSDMSPLTLVACRVLLAAAALSSFVLFRHGRKFARRCVQPDILLQGLLACALPYALITLGQKTVPSGLAAILNSTTPVFVCFLTVVVGRRMLSADRLVGLALGLGGVVLIVGADVLFNVGQGLAGQAAIVLATVSSAFAALYGRRFTAVPPEVVAAGALVAAATILLPLSFLVEAPLSLSPSLASLAALAVNGLAATAIGFIIYFRLIQTLGSLGAASVSYLKPAFGLMIGWTIMGEGLTWPICCGLVMIALGVAFANGGVSIFLAPKVSAALLKRA